MSDRTVLLRGIVRNGVVVPPTGMVLPEGAAVNFEVVQTALSTEEQKEFDGWNRLGDEAWAMIDVWEKEERDARR